MWFAYNDSGKQLILTYFDPKTLGSSACRPPLTRAPSFGTMAPTPRLKAINRSHVFNS